MIKPLVISTLACSLSTIACAQSSAIIYGLVDQSVQHVKSGDNSALNGGSLTRLADGTIYGPGSRWGIKASEDLGAGLKANVLLESGFLADTGTTAQGGRGFGRQSFVGLSSVTAGEVRLGRQYTLHDETLYLTNPTLGTTAMNPGGIYTLRTGTINPLIDAPRLDNAIQYISPIFHGFRIQALVGLSEKIQDRYQGIKINYIQGPLTVIGTYEQSKANTIVGNDSSTVNKIFQTGGSYNFGAFSLFGAYQNGRNLTTGAGTQIGTLTIPGLSSGASTLKAYSIGASVPVGTTVFMLNYTRSLFGDNAGNDASIARLGAGANYYLSKSTAIYGVVTAAMGDLKNAVNEKRVYQLGLRKVF